MRLTRRDALVAVAAGAGASVAGVGLAEWHDPRGGRDELTEKDHETLLAVAAVVYPSAVRTSGSFVETYAERVHRDRRRAIARAIDDLDRETRRRHGSRFASLDREGRDDVLRGMGVHRVQPAATGTVPERIRSVLVNGLLFALYSSPTGSRLVGIENPVGYPGGLESYQRSPNG